VSFAHGPASSFIIPIPASLLPSMIPNAAADPHSTEVSNPGTSEVAIS
jgi:hypothetical protein